MENEYNNSKFTLDALRKKILTIDDVYDFCMNNSKNFIHHYIDLYFPQCKGFTVDFFYQVISGEKHVSIFIITNLANDT